MTTKRLGRGLAGLIETAKHEPAGGSSFILVPTAQVRPGRFQPRTSVNETDLEGLKASITRQGVLAPILVRPLAHGTYEIVAGERRWRAAQALGMKEVPAIVRPLTDRQSLEFSLIENVQRENLNAIEEARGYGRLLDEFGYTQEDIASAVGKDRATIANALRLLRLPPEIQQALHDGRLSAGHAKVLVGIESAAQQRVLFQRIERDQLSVRQLEGLAGKVVPARHRRAQRLDPEARALEANLQHVLGTKVRVVARKRGGRIIIEYFSHDDLARLLTQLGAER